MCDDYIKLIYDNGGEVYVVGGAVRNYLYDYYHNTNTPIKDFDYLVRFISENNLIKILKKMGNVKEVGNSFGIVLFTPKNSQLNIEFAIPRTEISTGTGYKDFKIISDCNITLEEDFSRRDSTINAIGFKMYSLKDLELFYNKKCTDIVDNVIDPFGGVNDIKNKIWKCVGDPNKRFVEDSTRIMRAFRQSTELDLEIEINTLESIKKNYTVMQTLIPQSYVRLYNEFLRMLKYDNFYKNLICLNDSKILNFLGIIEINMKNMETVKNLENIKLRLKFALLLEPHTNKYKCDIKSWIYLRQITATHYFSSNDLQLLIAIQDFYNKMLLVSSKYEMLKIIEIIYKLFGEACFDICSDILFYLKIINLIDDKQYQILFTFLFESKKYPFSTNHLVINGNSLITKWGLQKGKQIGEIKNKLLDMIYKDIIKNEINDIENFLLDLLFKNNTN